MNQFILFVLDEYAKDASWNIQRRVLKIQNLECWLNSRKILTGPHFGSVKICYIYYHVHKSDLLESITGPRMAQLKCDAVWSEKFLGDQPEIFKYGYFGQLLAPLWMTKKKIDGCA